MVAKETAMSSDKCCCNHEVSSPSVCQTLDELEFERGIWSSALNGEVEKLKKQLDKGIDPSVQDSSGYTALHYAARNGKEDVCTLLLARGASVNCQTSGGSTAIHRAAYQGHKNIVLLLLKYKADSSICDSDGKTALHKAAERSHLDVARVLLQNKPELKYMKDNKGQLPFSYVDPKSSELGKLLSD